MNLTFHWPDYRKVSFALPGFILFSLLLHAAAFTIFQAVYPPSGALMPPPATVTLLAPSSPEYRALLNWVDAGDPAVASRPQEIVPHGLMDLPYQPSYSEVNTVPLPGPSLAFGNPGAGSAPLEEPSRLLQSVSCEKRPAAASEEAAPKTLVRCSEALALRAPREGWAVRVNPGVASRTYEPAQYLVGVDQSGKVAYQFLQHSSGEPVLDREAEELLGKAAFAPGREMAWGMVSFYWGSEVYKPERGSAPERLPQ